MSSVPRVAPNCPAPANVSQPLSQLSRISATLWRLSKDSSAQALNGELRRLRNGHHRHHARLNGIGDDEVGGLRNASRHVQADDKQTLSSHIANSLLDFAT